MADKLPAGFRILDSYYWDDDPYYSRQLFYIELQQFVPERTIKRRFRKDKVIPFHWRQVERFYFGIHSPTPKQQDETYSYLQQMAELIARHEKMFGPSKR